MNKTYQKVDYFCLFARLIVSSLVLFDSFEDVESNYTKFAQDAIVMAKKKAKMDKVFQKFDYFWIFARFLIKSLLNHILLN